jgi:uncharacterized protein (UPF0335 family)
MVIHGWWGFDSRVLRRIFGHKREEVEGGWRKLNSEELYDEIRRKKSENVCYYSVKTVIVMFTFQNTDVERNNVASFVWVYKWYISLMEEHKLQVFDIKVLKKKILERKKDPASCDLIYHITKNVVIWTHHQILLGQRSVGNCYRMDM